MKIISDRAIYKEIAYQANHGLIEVDPRDLIGLVSESLEISKAKVRPVWKQWMKDAGWSK